MCDQRTSPSSPSNPDENIPWGDCSKDPSCPCGRYWRELDEFTIDGLLDLHAEHGDDITVYVTPEQMAYVHDQFKQDVTEIRTPSKISLTSSWRYRRIVLRVAPTGHLTGHETEDGS